jgi:hypothetical protein
MGSTGLNLFPTGGEYRNESNRTWTRFDWLYPIPIEVQEKWKEMWEAEQKEKAKEGAKDKAKNPANKRKTSDARKQAKAKKANVDNHTLSKEQIVEEESDDHEDILSLVKREVMTGVQGRNQAGNQGRGKGQHQNSPQGRAQEGDQGGD